MANLTFRSIFAAGSKTLGETASNPDVFDLFFPEKSLSNLAPGAGLLVFMTKRVNFEKNFITINAPAGVSNQSYNEARDEEYFVGRIVENPTTTWIPQIVRVPSDALSDRVQVGFHTRNSNGETDGNRDDFDISRIFLLYFGSEGSSLSSITSGLTM